MSKLISIVFKLENNKDDLEIIRLIKKYISENLNINSDSIAVHSKPIYNNKGGENY